MELIQASARDTESALAFYRHVADTMEKSGLHQWHWGDYPSEEILREDIAEGRLYLMRQEGAIAAAVAVRTGQDPEYDDVRWTCGVRPGVFHRLAVHPSMQGGGLGGIVLDDVVQLLRRAGCDCVRCDTSEENSHALRLYRKLGFRRCGTMHWPDREENYYTFDKPLMRETPLLPIPMTPAFRSGEATPWGGERLREMFGKQTGGDRTGESLEVSCIPGLESADPMGRKLPELIAEFREKLVGRYAEKPFPLLLKLIDARDRLSVQVHPNDAYAAARENGKQGKNEAWMILDVPEGGGELIYGVLPGTTLRAVREASLAGPAVELLLNRVKVYPGDVCYIPAGCIHAIGKGIVLYEIQQSSDLTYRFYDWDRTDANGRRRELHLDKAMDVTDLRLAPVPIRVEKSFGVKRVLNEESFTLDVIRTDSAEMLPEIREFGLLTVTEGEPELRFAGASMKMKRGDTCFLPATCPKLALVGAGTAALAMPH